MNEKNNLTTLHLLLVLTYITAGLNLFSYAITSLMMPTFKEMVETTPNLFPEQMKTMVDTFLSMPRGYFAIAALLYALELVGGILMWRLRRSGFHCYTLARLLLLLVPLLFIGREFLALGDVMFAVLFITAYWLILRSLGVFGGNQDNSTPNTPTTPDE